MASQRQLSARLEYVEAERQEMEHKLDELQKALDSLQHGTHTHTYTACRLVSGL